MNSSATAHCPGKEGRTVSQRDLVPAFGPQAACILVKEERIGK